MDEKAQAAAFAAAHPGGAKALLAKLRGDIESGQVAHPAAVIRDDPHLGKPTYHSNPPAGSEGPRALSELLVLTPPKPRARKPKPKAPTHPKLLKAMRPTGKPVKGTVGRRPRPVHTTKNVMPVEPLAVPVTDDLLDAPDGAVLPFPDGVTRERVGDAWEVRDDIALAAEIAGEPAGTVEPVAEDTFIPFTSVEIEIVAPAKPKRARKPKPDYLAPIVYTHATREAWMLAAVEEFRPRFEAAGVKLPGLRVSIGWPGGRGNKQNVVGQCWMSSAVEDGQPAIFVSPRQKDHVEILGTILHELVHSTGIFGHTPGQFGKLAAKVGLSAPWTSTPESDELKAELKAIAEKLGPFNHGRVRSDDIKGTRPSGGGGGDGDGGTLVGPPVQSTRMLKLTCPQDGYTVRTTRLWIKVGLPSCPSGHQMEQAGNAPAGNEEEGE